MSSPGRSSPQVSDLIERIRSLVAEQRELEDGSGGQRMEANWLEIGRLQRRLSDVVRRELSESPP